MSLLSVSAVIYDLVYTVGTVLLCNQGTKRAAQKRLKNTGLFYLFIYFFLFNFFNFFKIHSSYHYPLMVAIVTGHNIKNINTNNVVSHTFYLFEGLLLSF